MWSIIQNYKLSSGYLEIIYYITVAYTAVLSFSSSAAETRGD